MFAKIKMKQNVRRNLDVKAKEIKVLRKKYSELESVSIYVKEQTSTNFKRRDLLRNEPSEKEIPLHTLNPVSD